VKNCVVLHHLATLFNNTNAVSHPSRATDCARCFLPNNYEILPNYKWKILTQYCQNSGTFFY